MSVQDIIFGAAGGAGGSTSIRRTWFEVMPVEDRSTLLNMNWSDICFDGVDTFAAIRMDTRSNSIIKRTVSFSKSTSPGQVWTNANDPVELLEADSSTATKKYVYNSICGNAGTFIVTAKPSGVIDAGIIQRLKYNQTLDRYERMTVFKAMSGTTAPISGITTGVASGYGNAYCSAYGNGTFVVGGTKWIAYSRDDGLTWKVISTPFDTNVSITYADSPTVGKVFVISTVFYADVNERVMYLSFDASGELILNQISKPSLGVAGGKVAYCNGVFLFHKAYNKFLFTRDLNNFYSVPDMPFINNSSNSILEQNYKGDITTINDYVVVVPSYATASVYSSIFVSNDTNSKTILVPNTSTGAVTLNTSSIRSVTNNSSFYVLKVDVTGTTWNSVWKKLPLRYSNENDVENWPLDGTETYVTLYARSEVGNYNTACSGNGLILAPRSGGDRLTILDSDTLDDLYS